MLVWSRAALRRERCDSVRIAYRRNIVRIHTCRGFHSSRIAWFQSVSLDDVWELPLLDAFYDANMISCCHFSEVGPYGKWLRICCFWVWELSVFAGTSSFLRRFPVILLRSRQNLRIHANFDRTPKRRYVWCWSCFANFGTRERCIRSLLCACVC